MSRAPSPSSSKTPLWECDCISVHTCLWMPQTCLFMYDTCTCIHFNSHSSHVKHIFAALSNFPGSSCFSPPSPSITLFYCQITPIDSERSEVMVSTVCGQEPMKRPNHTSAIMESSASLNDGIERYWKSKQRIHWLLSALRLSHLLRRGSVEAETALEQGRETDLISVQDLHVWPIKSAEVRGHQ